MSGEPVEQEEREKRQWQVYVWLDVNGEPRCIQTLGRTLNESWEDPQQYSKLPVDSGITGHPPRGDGVFFAVPFAVHRSPIAGLPGVILLCRVKNASGEHVDAKIRETDSDGSILGIESGPDGHLRDLNVLEVEQQFYLTIKCFPVAFMRNPPKAPGPYGSGVGADLAVGRATVMRAAGWLEAAGYHVGSLTPLATPSHWGISLRLASGKPVRSLCDGLMLLRFFVGWACEGSSMTPTFTTKVLQDPWPPSVMKVTAKVMKKSDETDIQVGQRLREGHEQLMRNVVPDSVGKEVEKYVWVSNGKGPVTVVTETPTATWLIDNRIPSSANPHTALQKWLESWV